MSLELVLTRGRTKAVSNSFEEGYDMWDWFCSQIGPAETKAVLKQIDKWEEELEKSGAKNENIQNRKRGPKTQVLDPPK